MFKALFFLPLFLVFNLLPITAATLAQAEIPWQSQRNPTLAIHNRVLTTVLGKPISLIDLVKKMDFLMQRQYPDLVDSPVGRYQFYTQYWQQTFSDLVDKELILADAKECQIEPSSSEVRQEIEQVFGPQVMQNLDKLNMTYQEAYDLLASEITLRRMVYAKVNIPAGHKVQPQHLRSAYRNHIEKNQGQATWRYRLLAFQEKDNHRCQIIADTAHQLLESGVVSLENLENKLLDLGLKSPIQISPPQEQTEASLSPLYKQVLLTTPENSYSLPTWQTTKRGDQQLRIFYVERFTPPTPPSFGEIEELLRETLLSQALEEKNSDYLNYLHNHFDTYPDQILSLLPEDFSPFQIY